MTTYTKLTDYAAKDALLTGNPSKLVKGVEIGADFDAVATADATNVKASGATNTIGLVTNAATGKTTPVDADELPISDSAASNVLKKVTFANLWVWIQAKLAGATGKTTPVDADTIPLTDSAASNVIKTLTWANVKATIKAYTDTLYAALAGSASQVFSVGTPTSASHAVQLQQVSLYPTVASATTIDIFGAAGATISVSGTTTVTGITACTAAQVGSAKTIIPSNAAGFSITASASLVVDGATSGTFLMPLNANIQIIATSTTTFAVTTIFAKGTWTPNQGAGLTVVGAFSSSGYWTKTGSNVWFSMNVAGATSVSVSSGTVISSNLPFTNQARTTVVNAINGSASVSHGAYIGNATTQCIAAEAFAATNAIYVSGQYSV